MDWIAVVVNGDDVESNEPPVVEIVPDVSNGKAPLQVHFDGDASCPVGVTSYPGCSEVTL